jgi:STE24 endopeptidase
MVLTGAIDLLLSLPLGLIYKFMVEESHGYNKQTLGGFFKDQLLGILVNLIITPIFMWVLLWIMYTTGDEFVWWSCLFITVFALVMIVISPLIIMPLFNKFDPMEDNLLKKDVERLASSIKYPISKVEVLDGSTRSGHSNAFQYGFGKIKKIVIFDTLLE